jgi:hypothetical protein
MKETLKEKGPANAGPFGIKKRADFSPTTQLAYHMRCDAVNRKADLFKIISDLHRNEFIFLENLPSCKEEKTMLSYRHKEVIPMNR